MADDEPSNSSDLLRASSASDFDDDSPRTALAKQIPRRPRVAWWLGLVFALGFAALVTPAITAERWLLGFDAQTVRHDQPAPFSVRLPTFGFADHTHGGHGGLIVARGELPTDAEVATARELADTLPTGPLPTVALFVLACVLGAIFSHHMRRSNKGRLIRVQLVSLVTIAVLAIAAKILLLTTAASALVVPVALLALIPTLALDRIVGLATGVLGALVIALLAPFDVGLAIVLLVQASVAGLVVAERPKQRWRAVLSAGAITTVFTGATFVLLMYLTTGRPPDAGDVLHSPWLAAMIGPAIATVLAVPLLPIYQLLVGEITQGKLIALEDLGHPLLRQIAERAPGTWQHSLMMANMAEIAANAIGASGRLVRVGAYFHDLGKSLQPKYFIENVEPGEVSPHDRLPPEVSCDAIFAHVTEGIVTARKAGLHERIVDFMHMHHGNGVLEYFWAKVREQGNPRGFTIEDFRYPGHPPQSRETAILAICDAVEAASRTLKKPDAAAIDSLVQRIVYGKLHLGQLDESGLSMSDLRRISDSLRETIRHANHGRIEYPWQRAHQDASVSTEALSPTSSPRLDSLDRKPDRDTQTRPALAASDSEVGLAATADVKTLAGEPSDSARVRAGRSALEPAVRRSPVPRPPTERGDSGRIRRGVERSGADEAIVETAPISRGELAQADRTPRATPPGGFAPEVRRASQALPAAPAGSGEMRASSQAGPIYARASSQAGLTEPPPLARKRAATLPPIALPRRAPTVPPARGPANQSGKMIDAAAHRSPSVTPMRSAGPPEPVDLDSAITNPPPLRRPPAAAAELAAELATTVASASGVNPTGDLDSAITNPPPTVGQASDTAGAQVAALVHAAQTPGGALRSSGLANFEDVRKIQTQPGYAEVEQPMIRPRKWTNDTEQPLRTPGPVDEHARVTLERDVPNPRGYAIVDEEIDEARVTDPRVAIPDDPRRIDPRVALQRAVAAAQLDDPRPTDPRIVVPRAAADDARTEPRQVARPDVLDDVRTEPRPVARPVAADDDAGVTQPTMQAIDGRVDELAVGDQRRVDLSAASASDPSITLPKAQWAKGLADRIDAALDSDEWSRETPIMAPTKAELRALLGQPDPTRQQSVDEIELLQRRAAELSSQSDARRRPDPTAEVDPDDIEAAIEVAPPARRPTNVNAIAVAKPKKPE